MIRRQSPPHPPPHLRQCGGATAVIVAAYGGRLGLRCFFFFCSFRSKRFLWPPSPPPLACTISIGIPPTRCKFLYTFVWFGFLFPFRSVSFSSEFSIEIRIPDGTLVGHCIVATGFLVAVDAVQSTRTTHLACLRCILVKQQSTETTRTN